MKVVTPESVGFSPARLQRISAKLSSYVDQGKLAGTIATVARRGQTVYLEKTGWMDREAQRPMQLDAIFRIASMTQHSPNNYYPLADTLKQLTYQALVDA